MATATQTSELEEAFENLRPGNTAYQCGHCGHLVGDPVDRESWMGRCPPAKYGGCHRFTTFYRVEE